MGKLKVYFDGSCYLCSAEVSHYRAKDLAQKIDFISIADPDFKPEMEGLDSKRVQQEMHARLPSGKLVIGVDAFVEIWKVIPGYEKAAGIAQLPGIRQLMDVGYFIFARGIRPWLPKKKCHSGACER